MHHFGSLASELCLRAQFHDAFFKFKGESRVIFYSIVEFLLNVTDPERVSWVYSDTDSIMLHVRGKCLEDGVLPDKRAEYEARKGEIFEDPNDPKSPAGKLKLEGVFARKGRKEGRKASDDRSHSFFILGVSFAGLRLTCCKAFRTSPT